MTKTVDLEDKVMLIEDAVDNNNQGTAESPTNDLIFYHFDLSNEVSTLPNHPVESNELLAFFESIV